MASLRHLQRVQPWVIPYSAEFQASAAENPWRQVEHDVMHVLKGLGRLAAWAEQADHGTVSTIPRAEVESNLADLVVCALHIASTLHLELEDAVIQNMERRNGVMLPPEGAEGAQQRREIRPTDRRTHPGASVGIVTPRLRSRSMAAEWLRADQVADIAAAHHRGPRRPACAYCLDPWPCETAQLAAQDGRWRALVGELLEAAADEPLTIRWRDGREYAKIAPRLQAALQAAQAALAGVPPASRGAAE